jgi:hypothetical protein
MKMARARHDDRGAKGASMDKVKAGTWKDRKQPGGFDLGLFQAHWPQRLSDVRAVAASARVLLRLHLPGTGCAVSGLPAFFSRCRGHPCRACEAKLARI